jgi:predicted nuclease with TOPRIM domain
MFVGSEELSSRIETLQVENASLQEEFDTLQNANIQFLEKFKVVNNEKSTLASQIQGNTLPIIHTYEIRYGEGKGRMVGREFQENF